MAKKQHNELIAGIFVIAALLVTIAVVLWLGVAEVFAPTASEAHFYVEESTGSVGLEVGNEVRVNDDAIGKITKIYFDPDRSRTIYVARIEREGMEIYTDGRAHAKVPPIGGGLLVITDRGSSEKPPADEKHPIALRRAGVMANLDDISKSLKQEMNPKVKNALIAKIHEIVDTMKTAMTDIKDITKTLKNETNPEKVDSLLAKIGKSVADINKATTSIRTELDRESDDSIIAKVHVAVTNIKKITTDARPKIDKSLTSIVKTTKAIETYTKDDVAEILKKLRKTNTEVLQIVKNFGTVSKNAKEIVLMHRGNVDEIIDNMAQVSANLKSASKEIRRSPWRLLYRPEDKELRSQNIHDAARAFSAGASELDQAMAKLAGLIKAHPEGIPADDPQMLKIKEQIQNTFSRFDEAEQALWKELTK